MRIDIFISPQNAKFRSLRMVSFLQNRSNLTSQIYIANSTWGVVFENLDPGFSGCFVAVSVFPRTQKLESGLVEQIRTQFPVGLTGSCTSSQ